MKAGSAACKPRTKAMRIDSGPVGRLANDACTQARGGQKGCPEPACRRIGGLLVFCPGGAGTVRLSRRHPKDQDPAKAAPNHNPKFFVDEHALVIGVRTMATLAVNFVSSPPASSAPK